MLGCWDFKPFFSVLDFGLNRLSFYIFGNDQRFEFWFLGVDILHVNAPIMSLPPGLFRTKSTAQSNSQMDLMDMSVGNTFDLSPVVTITKHATINALMA